MSDTRAKLEAVITASSQGFIDALKKASAAVNDSTASWKDRFTKARGDLLTMKEAIDNLKASAKQMGELGLDADPEMAKKLEDNLQRVRDALASTGADVRAVMEGINNLKNEAHSLGMPVDEFQRLGDAIKDAGIGFEDAKSMVRGMQEQIDGLSAGVPASVDLFGKLGMTLEQLGSRSAMGNFVAIADAIRGIVPPAEQAQMAVDMFGRTIDDVARVLVEYKRSLADHKDSEFINDRDVQLAINYRNEIEKLNGRMGPLGQKIEEVATVSSRFSASMKDVSDEFRRALDSYGKYVEGLPKSLKPTMEVMDALRDLREEVTKMINGFAALKNARPAMLKYYEELLQESGNNSKVFSEADEKALKERIESVCRYFADMKEVAVNEFKEIGDKWAQMRALFQNMSEWRANGDMRFLDVKPEQLLFNAESLIEARRHVEELHKIIEEFFKSDVFSGNKKIDFIDLDSLRNTADELRRMFDDYTEKMKTVAPTDFAKRFDILNAEIEKFQAKLDGLMNKDVTLRPKVDSSEMKNLEKEYESLVEKVKSFVSLYNEMQRMSEEFVDNKGERKFDFTIDQSQMALAKTLIEEMGYGVEGVKKSFEKIQDESRKLSAGLMENENWFGKLSGRIADVVSSATDGFGKALEATMNFGIKAADAVIHPIDTIGKAVGHIKDGVSAVARGFVSIATHPVEAVKAGVIAIGEKAISLGEAIKSAWHWMTHFKIAAEDSQHPVKDVGNQLLRIGGLLFGIRSVNMAIIKGLRTMGQAVKEIAMWWLEAAKNQAEMRDGIAKDASNQFKANRKEAEDRMKLTQKYAEAVSKANRSGKSEDRAEAEVIRKELWEKHAVRVNPETARKVFKEQSENYYDERMSQNEAETSMYHELVGQYRKALEERKKYLVSVFGMGSNLSMKMGEDTVYTDLTKKLGEAQKRLGELTKERTELGRTRRGGEYADWVAVNGGRNDDAVRENMRRQEKERDKKFKDREKKAQKANEDVDSWLEEMDTADEEERKIAKVWEKYNKIVKDGGDREKAYQAAMLAIQKIREEAERKDVEALERLADERDRELKNRQDLMEKEKDAGRRMIESYRAIMEAREAEAYRTRLDELGKARERLRKKMDEFGFKFPRGFKPGNPRTYSMSPKERRNLKTDAKIREKLEKRRKGERVSFTSRERRRLDEYTRLKGKYKALTAEERQIKAAQQQLSAAKTMESATKSFDEAVKKFFEAATGRTMETDKERRKREKREKRRAEIEKRRGKRRGTGWKPSGGEKPDDGRPRGWGSPAPAPKPGSRPRPAPGSSSRPRPAPAPSQEPAAPEMPSRFLKFSEFVERFTGDMSRVKDYYGKYVEMYDKMNGTKHDVLTYDVPQQHPPTPIERTLPPEYDNATRDQRARALWNRRAHPEDYDDEGNWKYSPKAWKKKAAEAQEQANEWGRETGWMPGTMTQRDFEKVVAGLYAPPRYTEDGNADRRDYTGLLERIATAIEKGDKNVFTVK